MSQLPCSAIVLPTTQTEEIAKRPPANIHRMTDDSQLRRLADYDNAWYSPGRGKMVCTLWYFVSLLVFESGWFPVSGLKVWLLRWFGAKIGTGVVIKPNVRIKYPWRLSIANDCWIGQGVWIDNLDEVSLASDVCLSQDVYLCTGSHDHRSATFELKTKPIVIGHGAWVACRAVVLAGSVISPGQVVSAGQVVDSRMNGES